jgi:hypothetical protein
VDAAVVFLLPGAGVESEVEAEAEREVDSGILVDQCVVEGGPERLDLACVIDEGNLSES